MAASGRRTEKSLPLKFWIAATRSTTASALLRHAARQLRGHDKDLVAHAAVFVDERAHGAGHPADVREVRVGHHADFHAEEGRMEFGAGVARGNGKRLRAGHAELERGARGRRPTAASSCTSTPCVPPEKRTPTGPWGVSVRVSAVALPPENHSRCETGAEDEALAFLAHVEIADEQQPLGRGPDMLAVAHATAVGARVDRLRPLAGGRGEIGDARQEWPDFRRAGPPAARPGRGGS